MQAFDDVVVLDLTQHIAGPYATRLLADLGADVLKIERPGGDPARLLPPFQGDDRHPEKSGLFFNLNYNKRSAVLDLKTSGGRDLLGKLAQRADLVVESFRPGVLERLGCGWDFLHTLNPALPLVSVSNFGQTGPYRDYRLSELVLYGFAGEMYSVGLPEREPVKTAGTAALFESGASIATAAAAALFASQRFGIGQHVDISLAETHLGGVDRRHATAIAVQFSGRKTLRSPGSAAGMPSGIYPCADGYVDFTAAGGHPERVLAMLEHAAWAADPRYADRLARLNPALVEEWNAEFLVWCLERSKREIWTAARRARVMCAPLYTTQDLYEDEHFRGRGFWSTVQHPLMGSVEIPGRPFILQHGGWQIHRPAPLLGEHTDEVLSALKQPRTAAPARPRVPPPPAAFAPTASSSHAPKPLAGYRVIDLCVVWAGPFATVQLGDLGAEVIKVENPYVWQPGTRGGMAHPPAQMLEQANAWGGGYPHNEPGPRPWNYCPTFVSNFRNKKSVTMDLRRPEGMRIFRRLVERSDVVYENNATGTMEKLGITYDWLRSVKPDIIFVRAPAYGSSGPYDDARALGVHLEGVMGHTLLRGYDDADPSTTTAIYSGDYLAGCQGALAVLAALRQRERSGQGQLVELAQAENAASMFTQAILDYTLNRRVQQTIGNRDIFGRFPCGVYPCKSPGAADTADDRWVSIHVESEAGWQALKRVMGQPAWAEDHRFASNAGRAEHCKELDAAIAAWTAEREDYAIADQCQAAGIAAMPVLEASRLFADPHLRARRFFRTQTLPDVGAYEFMGPMWQFGETPVEYLQPPATFGEHNEEVYRSILGYTDAEIEQFRAQGHIATEFDSSVP
jgi:crotonobetainyl-CoA:carnitine CoA-transferase CaiB-like acyl-CoA transferase